MGYRGVKCKKPIYLVLPQVLLTRSKERIGGRSFPFPRLRIRRKAYDIEIRQH